MRAAIAAAGLLASLACSHTPPATPLAVDDPRPRALIEAWTESARERRGLTARAQVDIEADSGSVSLRGTQLLVVERPARMRIEVLGWLDQTAAALVTDGVSYQFFQAQNRSLEGGQVHEQLLWELARLDLRLEDAVEILLGAPVLDRTLSRVYSESTADGWVRTELADEETVIRERATFDALGRLRELEVLGPEGELQWRVRYDDYTRIDGLPVALSIEVDVTSRDTRAEIRLSEVELDPDVPEGIYRLGNP
ncbi:DUF4292 domain-containing protein [Myxococcota bacterium]|nr:DUF4292 domain-containing protein [Myxococcota bacterium]